jgi:CysZ protein
MLKKSGPAYFFEGFKVIFQPKIRRYVYIPLFINFILFIGIWYAGFHYTDVMNHWIDAHIPTWLHWINWLIYIVVGIILLVATAYLFGAIAIIIGSPFYGMLAENVQNKYSENKVPESGWGETVAMVPKSIAREIRKVLSYIPLLIVVIILSFVPVINMANSVLWFLFGAWVQRIQFFDYPLDANKKSFYDLKQYLKQYRTQTFSFGMITMLFMMIPVINIIAIPAAVAGATLFYIENDIKLIDKPS